MPGLVQIKSGHDDDFVSIDARVAVTPCCSNVEEGGVAIALQNDVETIAWCARRFAPYGQQCPPSRRIVDRQQYRVAFIRRLVGEVDAGVELFQQTAGED